MPPLRSNPNVIIASGPEESRDLYARCEAGELDGFQLWVHDFVHPDGAVGIPAFVEANTDYHQIAPALIEEGVTKGPLFGWALRPTEERHGPGYGYDVGTSREYLRQALIEDGRIAPTRRAAAADRIRQLFGKESRYSLYRPRD